MTKRVLILLVFLTVLVLAVVEPGSTPTPELKEGQVEVSGIVVCTSCDLKKSEGAKSQCSTYGCNYAIKIKKAMDQEGKLVEDESGKLYHILANDNSTDLLQKKYKGKDVIIVGELYTEERVIEIEFVKLASEGKTYTCSMCGGDFDESGKCPKCGMNLIERE
jgi:rubrerythrin